MDIYFLFQSKHQLKFKKNNFFIYLLLNYKKKFGDCNR